jgi:energy-coupling factor transport system substrate-specific component
MSWPVASFLVVGLVLSVGWLAYERRRPSARMAAVVAVMSAFAALGRDAFVALPDVGALGMLVSNFVLGQGPYTPWQMAAWGLVGLGGAVLGTVTRKRVRRVPLALACAFAALIAEEIMDLYTWTLAAVHTPAAFLAVAAQGLPYDITGVVSSFLFGLAFAPELARVLARTRQRMDVSWAPTPLATAPADELSVRYRSLDA